MLEDEYFAKCKEVLKESAGVTLSNLLDHSSASLLVCQHSRRHQRILPRAGRFSPEACRKSSFCCGARVLQGVPDTHASRPQSESLCLEEAKERATEFTKR